MKFAIVAWFMLVIAVSAFGAPAPVIREPGAIYLADFDLKPLWLQVLRPADAVFNLSSDRYAGTLRPNQSVEVQAVSDTLIRVRGQSQQGQIAAWVSPEFLEPLPADFIRSLRASDERRIAVEALIEKNEIAMGMTSKEVERSIGRPNKRNRSADATKTVESWEYIKYANIPQQTTLVGPNGVTTLATTFVRTPVGRLKVSFNDGIVDSIEQSEGSILSGNQTSIVAPPIIVYE